jgi:hypothetical protein
MTRCLTLAGLIAAIFVILRVAVLPDIARADAPSHVGQPASGLDGLRPVSDSELSSMRGGFFEANGAEFDFAASVRTLVNGELALQSTVSWTPDGVATQSTYGAIPNAVPVNATELARIMGGDPNAASSGLSITSATGKTNLIANITGGQVQNVLMNTADHQTIAQNTSVMLTIYNFAAWQQQIAQHQVLSHLSSDMLAATLAAHH